MTNFTVYDLSTGEIKRAVSCPEADKDANIHDGEGAIDGHFNAEEFTVVNGVATMRSEEDLQRQASEEAERNMRTQRNMLLAASDFTQVPDAPFTEQQRQAWAAYRQALRDLPSNINDPLNIVWPTEPDL